MHVGGRALGVAMAARGAPINGRLVPTNWPAAGWLAGDGVAMPSGRRRRSAAVVFFA